MIRKTWKRLLNSPTFSTWLSFISKAASFLVVLPLILNKFSAADVTLWHLYLILWSLIAIFDAGFGSAFVRVISYLSADSINTQASFNNNLNTLKNGIEAINKVMKKFYLILGGICFILIGTIGTMLFSKPIDESSNSSFGLYVWFFFICTYPILLWGNRYINLLIGCHFIPVFRLWETFFNLLILLSILYLSLTGRGIHSLILTYQCWYVVGVYRNFKLVQNKITLGKKTDEKSIRLIKSLVLNNAMKSGLGVFLAQGITQGTSLVYAQYISPSLLAPYLVGLNIANSIKSFSQAPFYSKVPVFNRLYGEGNLKKLKELAYQSMNRVYIVFLSAFFFVTIFSEFIFESINSKVEFPEMDLWFLVGFGILIERFGAMHLQIYSTTNHIIWHLLNGITGLVFFGIFFSTIKLFGLYAFPIGYSVSYLCYYSWYAPKLSYQLLKTNFYNAERRSFIPFLLLFVIVALYFVFIK